MNPEEAGAIQFKLGDLGVARLVDDLSPFTTRNLGLIPPEGFDPHEFGPYDQRIDIYHVGLLLLQLAYSKEIEFSKEETLAGRPRELALQLDAPLNFALEKALRRHAQYRTANAMELWRDLHSPGPTQMSEQPPPMPGFSDGACTTEGEPKPKSAPDSESKD
jgi:hypothetical protein